MAANLAISVVVISFNQRDFIIRLVGQLLDQTLAASSYEIVVVECCSTDGTEEWLRSCSDARLRTVTLDNTCNRSAGRNHGIRAAHGDIIVMIDGDHTVNPDFLAVHLAAHQRGVCAIVGKSDFAVNAEFTAINIYLNNSGAAKLPKNASLPGRYFLTRNCSVPIKVLNEIGMFDESFDRWGGEDLDLGVRIENAGIPIYGEPEALALHHHFRSIGAVLKNVEAYGEGSVPILVRKHPRLFRELNLDRLFKNSFETDRFSPVTRLVNRVLCSAPLCRLVLAVSSSFPRVRQPRIILDYLHLCHYARGYRRAASNE